MDHTLKHPYQESISRFTDAVTHSWEKKFFQRKGKGNRVRETESSLLLKSLQSCYQIQTKKHEIKNNYRPISLKNINAEI